MFQRNGWARLLADQRVPGILPEPSPGRPRPGARTRGSSASVPRSPGTSAGPSARRPGGSAGRSSSGSCRTCSASSRAWSGAGGAADRPSPPGRARIAPRRSTGPGSRPPGSCCPASTGQWNASPCRCERCSYTRQPFSTVASVMAAQTVIVWLPSASGRTTPWSWCHAVRPVRLPTWAPSSTAAAA